ncbi:MAG TPA: RNA polymerase sigma factor [Pyrinomonadaceae bacterium]|nr:RNA polymerase sigma factor [Pyrinomonadaceae bacterium]
MREANEQELLQAIRSGDRDAMRDLYERHQRRVFSTSLNFFGGDHSRAEDVTQQVFLRLFRDRAFRGDAEFSTWLYRVTINLCIDESRSIRRFFGLADWFETVDPMSTYSYGDNVENKQLSSSVLAAVRSLRPKYRSPILLKYVEELSYQEIADVLECSIGTVSSRINRGMKLLAEKLEHLRGEI